VRLVAGVLLLAAAARAQAAPPGERVVETYPDGRTRSVAYVVNFVPRERVEYDASDHRAASFRRGRRAHVRTPHGIQVGLGPIELPA
jgi:hypothetical protein